MRKVTSLHTFNWLYKFLFTALIMFLSFSVAAEVCTETDSATGFDSDNVTVTISSFPCAGGEDIYAITMDASIGTNCPSWYSYDLLVNGSLVSAGMCNVTGYDLTSFLPITSVSIVSNDEDNYSDGITLTLTLNISYGDPPPPPTGCEYTVELYDDYGDGWNGGLLTVIVDGVTVLDDITLASGAGPGVHTFFAETDDLIEFVYTAGSWAYENEYYVYNYAGELVFSDGTGGSTPQGGSIMADCGECDYTVELYDDYGDGWNGGLLTVEVDGNVVLNEITLLSGAGPEVYTFQVTTDAVIDFIYTSGSWAYENEYIVYDANGMVVFHDGASGTTPTGGQIIGNCDAQFGTLAGVVTDENDTPLQGVTITAEELRSSTTTDANGEYELAMEAGTYNFTFSLGGFTSVTVSNVEILADEVTTLDVVLNSIVGSRCENPYIIDALPLVDYVDNTEVYGDFYSSAWVTPGTSYLNGNDFVAQFTLTEDSYLSGSVAGSWTGLIIVQDCPNPDAPATRLALGSGSTGGSFTDVILEPGTYFAIVSTFPSPQFTGFTLNLSAEPVLYGFLAGTVTDMDDNPLEGVVVNADGFETMTDINGEYELQLEVGLYDVSFSMMFYDEQLFAGTEIEFDQTTQLDVVMGFAPQPDCPLLVFPTSPTGTLPNAVLEWELPEGSAPAMGYKILLYDITADLWIEGDPDTFEGTDIGNTTTYVPAVNFEFGHQYSWMVTPYNLSGGPDLCTPWSFQVAFGGSIIGTVTDSESGLPIEGATVLIEQTLPNNLITTIVADENGEYEFEWETGNYKMTFSQFGYATQTFNNVTININQTTTRNAALVPYVPYAIPFFEGWDGGFAAQQWTAGTSWRVAATGNPLPTANFHWSPRLLNYSSSLESFFIDGFDEEKVYVQFDLSMQDYVSVTTLESLTFMVDNGNGWQDIETFTTGFGDIPWTTFTYDITDIAAGNLFKIGFRAYGQDNWGIDWWYVDNVFITTNLWDLQPLELIEGLNEGGTSTLEIDILNTGAHALPWEASLMLPIPWATMPVMDGVIPAGVTGNIDVDFDATGLAPGVYTGEIVFTVLDGLLQQVVPITLEVIDGAFQKIMIPNANEWGYVSTYIDLNSKMPLEDALADIIDEMIIMIGSDGIFWPVQEINTIGNWDTYKGYKLKMGEEGLLVFLGDAVVDKTVTFTAGTHIIPVLSEFPISAMDVFGPHDIEFAFGLDGSIYWPFGGIYSLNTLYPGYGYLVYFNQATTLDFNVTKSSTVPNLVTKFENTTPWNDVTRTGDIHIVGISEEAVSSLTPGDIVGVFSPDGICTGMSRYAGDNKPMAITVYGADMTTATRDGMEAGELMTLKVYSDGEITELDPAYSKRFAYSDGTFVSNGISLITDLKGATGIGSDELSHLHIYPNPSNGMFTITGADDSYSVVVMNAQGQVVYSSDRLDEKTLDLTSQPTGIYFIRLIGNDQIRIEKVIIQ